MASLSPAASPGPDGISTELLRLVAHIISPGLLTIMNNALQCSYFPAQSRHAKVKIIPKPGKVDYSLPSSFRPISIVSTLSKVFEKIILSRLSWISNYNNWFSERQHGFREGKSTESAAHQLVSFIETGFAKGLSTATAFIDIQSAFDRASHHAILAALVRKKCPVYLVRIIASFLENRRATLFNDTCSYSVDLHTGCPQGSVLSAFLWLVLVNDVLEIPFDFVHLNLAYADDITLAAAHRDPETATANLQKICAEVGKWSSSVDLTINARKTTFMLFSRKRNIPSISLQLEGQSIQPVRQFSYLGFLLEQRLSWLPHIQAKCLTAKKLIFAARRYLANTWGLSMLRLKKIYVSAIEPMLLYGCSLWCPGIDRARPLAALRSFQRLSAVVILRTFKSTSAEACLALCGLLPIELRIAELAANRLLSFPVVFSPSAAKTIHKIFPNIDLAQQTLHPTRFFSPVLPPWNRPPLPPLIILPTRAYIPLLPAGAGTVRVYTDGSVISKCTGYGLLICNDTGILATCRGKLPDTCSIFQAEGQAILQGLRFATEMSPPPISIEIFSDSRAALISSLSSERITSPFLEIRKLLFAMHNKVQLFWIASHQGHEGNEIADTLAKQGALGPGTYTDFLPPPVSSIRFLLRQAVKNIWEMRWANCTKASITRSFFPTIECTKPILNMDLPCSVVQVFSGHSRLRTFLFRIACAPSPICPCARNEETVEHFIFHCSLFDRLRTNFKATSLRYCHMWPPRLSDIVHSKPLLLAFITFIVRSKHLERHIPGER